MVVCLVFSASVACRPMTPLLSLPFFFSTAVTIFILRFKKKKSFVVSLLFISLFFLSSFRFPFLSDFFFFFFFWSYSFVPSFFFFFFCFFQGMFLRVSLVLFLGGWEDWSFFVSNLLHEVLCLFSRFPFC